jgi:hypothetical protein
LIVEVLKSVALLHSPKHRVAGIRPDVGALTIVVVRIFARRSVAIGEHPPGFVPFTTGFVALTADFGQLL